jgi:hypothetical protein
MRTVDGQSGAVDWDMHRYGVADLLRRHLHQHRYNANKKRLALNTDFRGTSWSSVRGSPAVRHGEIHSCFVASGARACCLA